MTDDRSNQDFSEDGSRVSWRKFGISLSGAAVFTVLLLYLYITGGIVYSAVGVSDVGGFTLQIEEVNGDGLYIYPGAGDSSNCPDTRPGSPPDPDPNIGQDALPQIYLEALNAQVPPDSDISFTKDIAVPDAIPGLAGFEITLTRDTPNVTQPLTLGDVQVGLTDVTADNITLTGGGETDLVIGDNFRGDSNSPYPNKAVPGDQIFGNPYRDFLFTNPGSSFIINGAFNGNLYVKDATANAHFLSFSSLNNLREFSLDVDYVSDRANLDVAEGTCPVVGSALFVFIENVNDPVQPGNTLSVNVTVQNPGADPISGTVELYLDGTFFDSQSVSFSGQGTQSITLSGTVSSTKPFGFYTAKVNTSYDESTEEVAVGDPPNVNVQITSTNSPVIEGEKLNVTADLTNTGDITANQQVSLDMLTPGGNLVEENVDSIPITLSGGSTVTRTFSWQTSEGDAANYQARVQSRRNNDTASVTVKSDDPSFQVNITGTNEPVYEGETLTATVNITNVGVVGGTQEVSLTVINSTAGVFEKVSNKSVTVSAGASKTITLPWYTQTGDADNSTYTLQASSGNDTDQITNQAVKKPTLRLVNVNAENSVDVGNAGTNDNTLQVDITVENTAGPNATSSISGDVYLDVDRTNNGVFVQRDSQLGVTVSQNSQQTVTLSATVNLDSAAPNNENGNLMPVRGRLEEGDPAVVPDSQTDTTTLNAPFYEVTINSITDSDGVADGNPQIGNTGGGSTNVEDLEVSITVQNTGGACGPDNDANMFIDNSGGQIYNDTWFTPGNPICPGDSFTETNTVFNWDADNEMNPESPSDVSATADFRGLPLAYQSNLRTLPNTGSTPMNHPEDFTYTLNSADSSIQAGDCGDCTFNVNFDITNNADVTDTTHVTLDIMDNGDGSGPGNLFDTDEASVTIGSGNTASQGLSHTFECNDFSEDDDSYPFGWNIDQEFQEISNPSYGVLSGSFTVDAGTSSNFLGSPDPCGL